MNVIYRSLCGSLKSSIIHFEDYLKYPDICFEPVESLDHLELAICKDIYQAYKRQQ